MKSFLPLFQREWRLLLFGFTMTFGSSLGQTYFIALFSGEIRADLGLSHGEFGSVYSAATLTSAVILLWSGALLDRMNLRHFAYLVVFGLALGCFLLASSYSLPMLFLSLLVLRQLGQGLMGMTGATAVVRYINDQPGKANAISGLGFSISEAILPSLVIASLAWLGWRQSWMLWGLLLAVALPLLIHRLLRHHEHRHAHYLGSVVEGGSDNNAAGRRQWTRPEVLRDPVFYLCLPAMLAQPMLFTGFMFHQIHLVEQKGWALPIWGSLYLVYALTTTVTKLGAGLLIDRLGAARLLPIMCMPLGVGLLVLSSSSSLLVAVLFMFCLGLSVGIYSTVSSPFFAEVYGSLHLGSIKSVTTSAMVFSSAITPVLMGWGIDRGTSMDSMALVGTGYVVLACLLAWLGCRALAAPARQNSGKKR